MRSARPAGPPGLTPGMPPGAGEGDASPRRSISMSAAPAPPPPPPPMGLATAPKAGACGVAACGAGAPMSMPPRMSASKSCSPAGLGACTAATGAPPPFDSAPPPTAASCAAWFFFFFSMAGMRSSTPDRMLVCAKSDEYSTERCCSSSAMEVRKGSMSERTRPCASVLSEKRAEHLTSALSTYSLVVTDEVTDRSTLSSRSSASLAGTTTPPWLASRRVSAYSPMHHTPTCTRVCATFTRSSLSAWSSLDVV
mmetsp:Transcript_21692/g.58400  ORF Transcript_21692/g.58400 Transcript_21692/m.58400 type:complete len:253 (-) Transcript_21692:1385-2143(-)